MPDWMSWLHMPKFTDSEFQKQKDAYVLKHGYTITVPGFSDIIILSTPKPMDSAEKLNWKRRDYGFFAPERLEEIQEMKAKKKDRYLAMLSSPTPGIVQNLGSIMCAIDDAQDAISTLACIGSVARAIAPKLISKILLGPVGLLWTVSDALNLLQNTPYACLGLKDHKRAGETMTKNSPNQTKTWVKRAPRMKRAIPRKADWIQAAQVTTSVFGFGISLGPIVGLLQDVLFGAVKTMQGNPPKIKLPVKGITRWAEKAYRTAKSQAALWCYIVGTDDDDVLAWISASTLANQVLQEELQEWHPLDGIEDVQNLQVLAPIPQDPLTLEVIEEGGIPLKEVIGWPQTNTRWASVELLADTTQAGATENLRRFAYRNKHSFRGLWGTASAVESARFGLACLEGPDAVKEDYTPAAKTMTKMLGAGITLDPSQPAKTLRDFAGYLYQNNLSNFNPTVKEIRSFCGGPASIKLVSR